MLNRIDHLAEYAADIDEWETMPIPKEVMLNCDKLDYYSIGKNIYKHIQNRINESLDSYIGVDGTINGSELQSDWFPSINAHVFLSHSHKDEKLAIRFAGWLYYNFGLITFIDSCIWSYSDDLLKKIDENIVKIRKEEFTIMTREIYLLVM